MAATREQEQRRHDGAEHDGARRFISSLALQLGQTSHLQAFKLRKKGAATSWLQTGHTAIRPKTPCHFLLNSVVVDAYTVADLAFSWK